MRNTERKKILLFGSEHCSGCGPAKELLEQKGVKFVYIDITADMARLQMFLKMRDTSESFAPLRGGEKIGIPSLQVNDREYVLESIEHLERLVDELGLVW